MGKRKAIGHRGSWFADVGGESLPCVHRYWWKNGEYHDPNFHSLDGQWSKLIDALKSKGRAILTNDDTPDKGNSFTRTGYIAVYEIEDVRIEDGLRFRFVRKIEELA